MLEEYKPGAIFMIEPGTASVIASWMVLYGPLSESIIIDSIFASTDDVLGF
jgi:hypothetical protein